ncbi:hypothetical protein [Candidatus Chloroploca asiatica]|uniref:hypothetical protein n=1 Tax=Candidatus Chloroploca asiatica TaxID=1506545 RepID=UPI00155A03F9|nr:hypothetical protein [Candidatus Chloroploca asiatica]
MKLETPSKVALTEYVLAPWHLRLRWWACGFFWSWCQGFEAHHVTSPEQANPLWRR